MARSISSNGSKFTYAQVITVGWKTDSEPCYLIVREEAISVATKVLVREQVTQKEVGLGRPQSKAS